MTGFQLPNQSDRLIESFGVGAEGGLDFVDPALYLASWRLGGEKSKLPVKIREPRGGGRWLGGGGRG